MHIRIATRKSTLALAQAEEVATGLFAAHPDLRVELVPLTTSGDAATDKPLTDIGGKGLFTKEIEEALLEGRADIAVHSMKDMPTMLPDGLTIACMLEREDPRDVLIGRRTIADIPKEGTFGTSSLRRASQMLMKRPDVKITSLRGNVETRITKARSGLVTVTMLARAGLNRLGLPDNDITSVTLEVDEFLPAIAQGAIGIECKEDNQAIRALLAPLSHAPTETAVNCERAFLKVLDGSCRTPIAGYALLEKDEIHFRGLIVKPDGSAHHRVEVRASAKDAEKLGQDAGKTLKAKAGKNFI